MHNPKNFLLVYPFLALLAFRAAAQQDLNALIDECEAVGNESGEFVAQAACAALLKQDPPSVPNSISRPTIDFGPSAPEVLLSSSLAETCEILFRTNCQKTGSQAVFTSNSLIECQDLLNRGPYYEGWYEDLNAFDGFMRSFCEEQETDTAPKPPPPPPPPPPAPAEEVVSRGRPTFQSTTAFGGESSRAVDGNRDSNYGGNSCTHTGFSTKEIGTPNPWWTVDLGATRKITRIKVTNRGDCCSDRLNNFEIRVGDVKPLGDGKKDNSIQNPLCSSGLSVKGGKTREITCERSGRYVTIRIPGNSRVLTLCEVEVFGEVQYGLPISEDVVLSRWKPTFQSSYAWNGWSNKAVDGNKRTRYSDGSCTHTLKSRSPWWAVDLGSPQKISRIRITNRSDCCADRLSNFEIRVGNVEPKHGGWQNTMCAGNLKVPRGQTYEFDCPATGRFVSVRIPGIDKILTLCEVEVLG